MRAVGHSENPTIDFALAIYNKTKLGDRYRERQRIPP